MGNNSGHIEISHIFFADDTLIFCQPNTSHLIFLKCILICFQAVSGLKINLHKSELVDLGCCNTENTFFDILGCKKSTFPITYLGVPLGIKKKDKRCWEPVIEPFNNRLATWKRKFLSQGVRLTLIKSTLSNLSIYYLFVINIPTNVTKKLEATQCNFLWGTVKTTKNVSWLSGQKLKNP